MHAMQTLDYRMSPPRYENKELPTLSCGDHVSWNHMHVVLCVFCTHIHIVILRPTFMFTRVALADFFSHMTMVTSNFVCRFVAPVSRGSCNNQSAITQPSFSPHVFSIFKFFSLHFCDLTVFTFVNLSSPAFVISDFYPRVAFDQTIE